MGRKPIDLTGQRFGRLTVLEQAGRDSRREATWWCICDCGNKIQVPGYSLRRGNTQSCGCLKVDIHKVHGGYYSRLYKVWFSMKQRCYNPKSKDYKNYGGRGIIVCDEWLHDFETFRDWALQIGYDENAPFGECTIDRIDVNGNYEPCNCRWITIKEQRKNQRPKPQK